MAVDTSAKRKSMLSFDSIGSDLLCEPDGAVNADDRAALLGLYSGFGSTGSAATTPGSRSRSGRNRSRGALFVILFLLLAGCDTVTEVREIKCATVEFYPPGTSAEQADSVVYRNCEPPEWDGFVVRFR